MNTHISADPSPVTGTQASCSPTSNFPNPKTSNLKPKTYNLKPKTSTPKPIALLLLGALCFALPASGAVDMFIKIGDIKGESQDSDHNGEIDVLSWSWGSTCASASADGGGGGAGKANFQDLSLTKYLDKATPKIYESCANGTHHSTAVLTLRRAGDRPLEYLIIRMEDVLITSVSTGGSGGEDRLTENVTLNFKRVEMTYTEQTADGGPGEQVVFAFDIESNTGG